MKYLLQRLVVSMSKKFWYLTKVSLNKKIKTKWFFITNAILAIIIIALLNINSIITFFGGDFDNKTNIVVIDNNTNSYNLLENNINSYASSLGKDNEDLKLVIKKSNQTIKEEEKALKDDTIIVELNGDEKNYLKAKIVSNKKIDTVTYQILSQSLTATKSSIAMEANQINQAILASISAPIEIDRLVLNEENSIDENMNLIINSIFPTVILPFFMLTIFLIQMVGGEICEEKTTRSMEIIISNVSPKVHLLSKVLASNIFVIIQGLLLVIYTIIGFLLSTNMLQKGLSLPTDMISIFDNLVASGFIDKLVYAIPLTLILMVLSFIAYSVVAGILASMTVNMEDFSQLQTPIVLISLVGYYLAMMAGMFEGSTFIRVLSYIPFLSAFVSPSLYMMGQISIIDIIISIIILIGFIYLLLKVGLKVYKVGILNYSNEKVWHKFFKAFTTKNI